MTVYLDTSALVTLFIEESATPAARLGVAGQAILVSDFAAAEFSAAIARRARTGDISRTQALQVLADFDLWIARGANWVSTESPDVMAATALVRRLELGLRAPDALHLALARRLGADLLTFDTKMVAAAEVLGVTLRR